MLSENNREVVLVSPGYPSRYQNSLAVQTEVTSLVPRSNIVIEWIDFQVEAEGNCSFDRVTITEQVSVSSVKHYITMTVFYSNESPSIFILLYTHLTKNI